MESSLIDPFSKPYCTLDSDFAASRPCQDVSADEFANYLYDFLHLDQRLKQLYDAGFDYKRQYEEQREEIERKYPEATRVLAVTILLYMDLYDLGEEGFDLFVLFADLHEKLLVTMVQEQEVLPTPEEAAVWEEDSRYNNDGHLLWDIVDDERSDILALIIRKYDLPVLVELFGLLEQDDFCRYCDADIFDLLLEKNYPFDWNSLYGAASKELNIYAVRRLLEKGVLQQDASASGWTNDMSVGFFGFTSFNVEVMNLFMAYGANPREINSRGETVLNYLLSTRDADEECVDTLLSYGVDASIPDQDKNYPIIYAIKSGYSIKIMKLLIAAGADVNCVDGKGRTPLYCARKNKEMVEFLLSQGATNYGKKREKIDGAERRERVTHGVRRNYCGSLYLQ